MLSIRKRGKRYRLEGRVGSRRVRFSLGTRNQEAAVLMANKIERALVDGKGSKLWGELVTLLPSSAFERLSSLVGYRPSQPSPTWAMLLSTFNTEQERQVVSGTIRPSTKKRGDISLKEFSTFLREKNISNLSDINTALIVGWKAWRTNRILGKKQSRKGAPSLIHDLAALHKVFNYGLRLECDWVTKNPVRTEKPRQGEPNPWTGEELEKLEAAATQYELFLHRFLLETGFRNGDACAVRWEQVDLENRCIPLQTQKRAKLAWVPLGPEIHFMLETEKQQRGALPNEHVLLNRQGRPFTVKSLLRLVQGLARRAGVKNAKVHRYRHTFISHVVASGASYADVGRMVGDSAATIEKFYAKFSPEWQQRLRRFVDKKPEIVDTLRAHSTRPSAGVN